MSRKKHNLTRLPTIDIPYRSAFAKYGVQVATLMDRLAESGAEQSTKSMPPSTMKWSLACERSPDPPNVTDQKVFSDYLAVNSSYYLKVIAGKWISFEPVIPTPPQFMAQFEQRARHITTSRLEHLQAELAVASLPEALEQEPELLKSFREWCEEHDHDQRWATIARIALEHLIESDSDSE